MGKYDNYVRTEIINDRMVFVYRCANCGATFTIHETVPRTNLCIKCRYKKDSSKNYQRRVNLVRDASKKLLSQTKLVIRGLDKTESVKIDGKRYVSAEAVLKGLEKTYGEFMDI